MNASTFSTFFFWFDRVLIVLLILATVRVGYRAVILSNERKELASLTQQNIEERKTLRAAEELQKKGFRAEGLYQELQGWLAVRDDMSLLAKDFYWIPRYFQLEQLYMERELLAPNKLLNEEQPFGAPCEWVGRVSWTLGEQKLIATKHLNVANSLEFIMSQWSEESYELMPAGQSEGLNSWLMHTRIPNQKLWVEVTP